MTQNQIAYQQLMETNRHNQVTEGLERRKQDISVGATTLKTLLGIKDLLPFVLG